jgi:hypothetical protein
MSLILDRYPFSYRHETVQSIINVTQEGHSLCLVGLAGVGKSNLVHFLEQPEIRALLKREEAGRTHFLGIPCAKDIRMPEEVYRSLSSPLVVLERQLGVRLARIPEQTAFDDLRNHLKTLCRERNQRIVFILDEFEQLARNQPLELFEALRILRDDHRTTGNLVYILLMHRMPQVVAGSQLFVKSRLFEIVREHIYPLGPYNEEDALTMLDALCAKSGMTISQANREKLCAFSGGHSGIMRAIFMAIRPHFDTPATKIARLAANDPGVAQACQHLWDHLHPEERSALLGLVEGASPDLAMKEFLIKRGLLKRDSGFFSIVFEEFVKNLALE